MTLDVKCHPSCQGDIEGTHRDTQREKGKPQSHYNKRDTHLPGENCFKIKIDKAEEREREGPSDTLQVLSK